MKNVFLSVWCDKNILLSYILQCLLGDELFGCDKELKALEECVTLSCRISSPWTDLGGFPPGTQTAGSLVKVPLNLLERIILEVEFSEQKEPANQPVDSLSLISLGQSFSGMDSSTWPPYGSSIASWRMRPPIQDFQRFQEIWGKKKKPHWTPSSLISSAVTVIINICCMLHVCLCLHPSSLLLRYWLRLTSKCTVCRAADNTGRPRAPAGFL